MPSPRFDAGRLAPVAVALSAVVLAGAFAYASLACRGASRCEPRLHEMALPFVGVAVVGTVGAAARRPVVPLAAGVLAAPVGSVFGLSMGLYGVATAWLLALAGALAHRDRVVAGAGLVAAFAPFVVMMVAVTTRAAWLAHPWPALVGPAALWVVLAAARRQLRKD